MIKTVVLKPCKCNCCKNWQKVLSELREFKREAMELAEYNFTESMLAHRFGAELRMCELRKIEERNRKLKKHTKGETDA